MKIEVIRKMQYEKTLIHVFQFDITWMYLFAIGNEIYQDRFEAKPTLWRWMLWKTGVYKNLYTPHQMDEFEKVILNGAMDSYDKINKIGFYAVQEDSKK